MRCDAISPSYSTTDRTNEKQRQLLHDTHSPPRTNSAKFHTKWILYGHSFLITWIKLFHAWGTQLKFSWKLHHHPSRNSSRHRAESSSTSTQSIHRSFEWESSQSPWIQGVHNTVDWRIWPKSTPPSSTLLYARLTFQTFSSLSLLWGFDFVP